MIIRHRGISPQIDSSAYVAPTAVIAGNVRIGAKARVMFGAVINIRKSAVSTGSGGKELLSYRREI